MKKLLIAISITMFMSCADKAVKLPLLAEPGVHNIQNHSQVWLFFETKNGDTVAKVNRKNTISSTHWIFNIDKRLKLKDIIDELAELKEKHHTSVHSLEGMHDYFSYADTLNNQISLLAFDHVEYQKARTPITTENINSVDLVFTSQGVFHKGERMEKTNLEAYLIQNMGETHNTETTVTLNFSKELLFGDYLYFKTLLHRIFKDKNLVNPRESIFDALE